MTCMLMIIPIAHSIITVLILIMVMIMVTVIIFIIIEMRDHSHQPPPRRIEMPRINNNIYYNNRRNITIPNRQPMNNSRPSYNGRR